MNDKIFPKYLQVKVQDDHHLRLDAFLAARVESLSRTKIHALIQNGNVMVNGSRIKPSYRLNQSDEIAVTIPEPEPLDVLPVEMPLDILYEDTHYLAINKPPGLVVHPGAGNKTGTLVSGLLHHTKTLSTLGGKLRPGLVHRLDKDTSGVLIAAKTDEAHWKLGALFADRKIYKEYRALVWGIPQPSSDSIEAAIGRDRHHRKRFSINENGKFARSRYETIDSFEFAAHLKVIIETGRTHQIRVHLQSIGHPVIGDQTYGSAKHSFSAFPKTTADLGRQLIARVDRQMLHAYCIRFTHPFTDKGITITAPFPEDFLKSIKLLKQSSELIDG